MIQCKVCLLIIPHTQKVYIAESNMRVEVLQGITKDTELS